MRGNAYSRLRRTMARALRRAIAGSTALALLVIAVVSVVLVSAERSEAGSVAGASTLAVAANQRLESLAGPPPSQSTEPKVTPGVAVPSIVPDLVPDLDDVELASDYAPLPLEGNRRVGVAAIGQVSGTQASGSTSEAVPLEHVPWGDEPVVVEPPFVPLTRSPQVAAASQAAASPPLVAGDVIEATISFYYCEQGDTANGGDGGGFCGAMRDGTIVYEGAAACAFVYLGQQFRIVGDPTERIYTCHDTGSAVHGLHRDIFFHRAADGWPWLQSVGTLVFLEILR